MKKMSERLKSLNFDPIRFCIGVLLVLVIGCGPDKTQKNKLQLFSKISPDSSHITFSNDLQYDAKFNIYTYRNFYNGGGVALGDVNNDGLPDIYFSANQGPNKLYLNKGNFVFEDVTDK